MRSMQSAVAAKHNFRRGDKRFQIRFRHRRDNHALFARRACAMRIFHNFLNNSDRVGLGFCGDLRKGFPAHSGFGV